MPSDPSSIAGSSSARRSQVRHTPHNRTYQACHACRSAKLRCDMGSPDAPHDPPCRRCLRTGRECFFVGVYQKKVTGNGSDHGSVANLLEMTNGVQARAFTEDESPSTVSTGHISSSFEMISSNEPLTTPNAPRTHHSGNNVSDDFRFVRGETLENPADALRILCAAAEEPQNDLSSEIELPIETGLWNRWIPVRDGLLWADEAGLLLSHFAENLNHCNPLVPVQLLQPVHFNMLLREPILLAVMIGTAARYLDLGPSFDMSEPSRSRVIQGKIVTWLLQRIGFIAMGETTSRTIGTVEALLILSEWPPRAVLLSDTIMAHSLPGSSQKQRNPCTVYDDLSWTVIGLAVRIAQELELQNENYVGSDEFEWSIRRRHNAWICCLSADRHASVRLGRASLVQELSTCWWETVTTQARVSGDDTFPFPRTHINWRESLMVAQLTHTIGLLQELLYVTPEVTAELIKTGRFEITLHRLKPELDSLWHLQTGSSSSYSIFESTGDTFTEEELKEVRWRMEYDYVRLYANAIAMRAAQQRLLRRLKGRNIGDRVFQSNVIGSTEGPFVLEAVDAAISLVRCGVTMQRKQVLRYSPCRTFLRLVFASVFLMKAVSFGAVAHPEQEIVDLQYSLIESLTAASVDNEHIAAHLATLLSRVFPTIPAGPSQSGIISSENHLSDQSSLREHGATTLPLFGFDGDMIIDGGGLDWNSTFVTGLGYDPSSLVSDIEEMLAAAESHQSLLNS